MGIDFLDLTFHIEKNSRLKFDQKSIDNFIRAQEPHESKTKTCFGTHVQKFDYRVGRFFETMRSHTHPICAKCKKMLLTLSSAGACPDCGEPCAVPALTWDEFCKALGVVLQKPPGEIREDQWLIGDLGFS